MKTRAAEPPASRQARKRGGARRPVMVWFHGGGFSSLSGSSALYDGGAWLAFARCGDLNHLGIPHWPTYTKECPSTLLFDVEPRVERDCRGGEREALREVPLHEFNR